jgi:hypothetical protein
MLTNYVSSVEPIPMESTFKAGSLVTKWAEMKNGVEDRCRQWVLLCTVCTGH